MKTDARWITDKLPDSDITVLMRLEDAEYPVWPGFHDGEDWAFADGAVARHKVTGWMHLEDAATALDNHPLK